MLSLFPSLFVFSAIAPIVLRVTLALVLFFEASKEVKSRKWGEKTLGFLKAVSGLLLLVGFLTQLGAVFVLILTIYNLFSQKEKIWQSKILITAISLALILLGPGLLAFDLPF